MKVILISLLVVTANAQTSGTFIATGNMTSARILQTATLLADGTVLIAGGMIDVGGPSVSFKALASAELYDPGTGTFSAVGSMTTPRVAHTATLLPDGKVLITGGGPIGANGAYQSLASAELYDPSSGAFSATGDMTVARSFNAATLLPSGDVLIAGSFQSGSSAERYDPSTGTFTGAGHIASDFANTATLLTNGRVLITGSFRAELYDPSTGAFSITGSTAMVPTATLLTNGKVLVSGGDVGDGSVPSMRAQLYNAATGAFENTGNMITAREQHTATLLPDGTVLIAGNHFGPNISGAGGGINLALSAELYDPVTGSFSATSSMTTGREMHTATLLKNGKVLITGGDEYWPTALASAELYSPPLLTPSPVLFSLSGDGKGQGAILHASTPRVASSDNPAAVGEALEIYATGLFDGSVIPPQVAIGGRLAEILFFGNAPGYPGFNQVNVRVPGGVAPGSAILVRLTYLGRSSNEVTIAVQ